MTVTVSDWTTGFNKVRFNDLLRQYAGFRLGEAKRAVDRILDHEPLTIEIADETAAGEFSRKAVEIGAVIRPAGSDGRETGLILENVDENARLNTGVTDD
jgi:hypothetical protein